MTDAPRGTLGVLGTIVNSFSTSMSWCQGDSDSIALNERSPVQQSVNQAAANWGKSFVPEGTLFLNFCARFLAHDTAVKLPWRNKSTKLHHSPQSTTKEAARAAIPTETSGCAQSNKEETVTPVLCSAAVLERGTEGTAEIVKLASNINRLGAQSTVFAKPEVENFIRKCEAVVKRYYIIENCNSKELWKRSRPSSATSKSNGKNRLAIFTYICSHKTANCSKLYFTSISLFTLYSSAIMLLSISLKTDIKE